MPTVINKYPIYYLSKVKAITPIQEFTDWRNEQFFNVDLATYTLFHHSLVYAKLGKPAPVDEAAFMQVIEEGKIDEAISVYENKTGLSGVKNM